MEKAKTIIHIFENGVKVTFTRRERKTKEGHQFWVKVEGIGEPYEGISHTADFIDASGAIHDAKQRDI